MERKASVLEPLIDGPIITPTKDPYQSLIETLSVSQKEMLPSLRSPESCTTASNSTDVSLFGPSSISPPSAIKLESAILQTSLDRSNHKRKTSLNLSNEEVRESPLQASNHSNSSQGGSTPSEKGLNTSGKVNLISETNLLQCMTKMDTGQESLLREYQTKAKQKYDDYKSYHDNAGRMYYAIHSLLNNSLQITKSEILEKYIRNNAESMGKNSTIFDASEWEQSMKLAKTCRMSTPEVMAAHTEYYQKTSKTLLMPTLKKARTALIEMRQSKSSVETEFIQFQHQFSSFQQQILTVLSKYTRKDWLRKAEATEEIQMELDREIEKNVLLEGQMEVLSQQVKTLDFQRIQEREVFQQQITSLTNALEAKSVAIAAAVAANPSSPTTTTPPTTTTLASAPELGVSPGSSPGKFPFEIGLDGTFNGPPFPTNCHCKGQPAFKLVANLNVEIDRLKVELEKSREDALERFKTITSLTEQLEASEEKIDQLIKSGRRSSSTGKKEMAATFSPFSNVVGQEKDESPSPAEKDSDIQEGDQHLENPSEEETKKGKKDPEKVTFVVHNEGVDDNDADEEFEIVIKRLQDTNAEQKQHIESLLQQVNELKERNGHLVIKMVDHQVGGGKVSTEGGGTSTPPPNCAGVELFERMIKMSSVLGKRQTSGLAGSSGGSDGDDNNNNNNNEPNADEEPMDAEAEMKEKILSAQLAGWRNACDALIAKFEKADTARKTVQATNKELKALLKSALDGDIYNATLTDRCVQRATQGRLNTEDDLIQMISQRDEMEINELMLKDTITDLKTKLSSQQHGENFGLRKQIDKSKEEIMELTKSKQKLLDQMVLFSNLKQEHTDLQMLFFEQSRQLANKTRELTVLEKTNRDREEFYKASAGMGVLAMGAVSAKDLLARRGSNSSRRNSSFGAGGPVNNDMSSHGHSSHGPSTHGPESSGNENGSVDGSSQLNGGKSAKHHRSTSFSNSVDTAPIPMRRGSSFLGLGLGGSTKSGGLTSMFGLLQRGNSEIGGNKDSPSDSSHHEDDVVKASDDLVSGQRASSPPLIMEGSSPARRARMVGWGNKEDGIGDDGDDDLTDDGSIYGPSHDNSGKDDQRAGGLGQRAGGFSSIAKEGSVVSKGSPTMLINVNGVGREVGGGGIPKRSHSISPRGDRISPLGLPLPMIEEYPRHAVVKNDPLTKEKDVDALKHVQIDANMFNNIQNMLHSEEGLSTEEMLRGIAETVKRNKIMAEIKGSDQLKDIYQSRALHSPEMVALGKGPTKNLTVKSGGRGGRTGGGAGLSRSAKS